MHPDIEQIQRFLHGQLAASSANAVESHIEECQDCRIRVHSAQREESEIHALLGQLDHELPVVNAGSVMVRTTPGRPAAWRWAAAILLTLSAAAAAYLVPGSPIGALLYEWLHRSDSQQPAPAPVIPAPGETSAGIALSPGQNLVIIFAATQTSGTADISFSESGDVHVSTTSGAARFESDEDVLRIDNAGPTATFEIVIPQSAPRIEIRMGDERVFLKEGQEIVTGAAKRPDGGYTLSIARR
jgi:hypothetical protein